MTTLFKCLIGAAVCAFSTQVLHAEDTKLPYWKDIQTVAVNKEYPRTAFMTYDNRDQALTGEYETVHGTFIMQIHTKICLPTLSNRMPT